MTTRATTPPTTTASTPAAATAKSSYLLTVRSALIWGVALVCGAAAGVIALGAMQDAHVVLQVLAGVGSYIGGTAGAALTLNQLIAPGDP